MATSRRSLFPFPSAALVFAFLTASSVAAQNSEGVKPPSPPRNLRVEDVKNDGGGALRLTWETPGDSLLGYEIRRAESQEGPFAAIDTLEASSTTFDDRGEPGRLRDGQRYSYQVVAMGLGGRAESEIASGVPHWSLFNFALANLFLIIIVFFVLVLLFTGRAQSQSAKGVTPFVRKIAGLTAIEEAVGRATEMGRAVLYVPGIDDANNIQTIYSMIILGNVAKTVARYETPLIVPICKAFVVPLAEETVRQGYVDAGRPDAYNANNIRYLSDEQFAFTAGVDGIMLREKPAANLFLGSFFAESLILAETGFATGAVQIAGTANIHQLPFFVVACDYTLIGEEFYAASAYLSRSPKLIGVLKGTDLMKILLIVLMVVGALASSLGWEAFRQWFVIS